MKDKLGWQPSGRGDYSAAGWASAGPLADGIQFTHDFRAARAMDGAIYSAATRQSAVGRVDDRIHGDLRNIALHQDEAAVLNLNFHCARHYFELTPVDLDRMSSKVRMYPSLPLCCHLMLAASSLILFDIDGTLLRRAGPHHRHALLAGVERVMGISTTMDHIVTSGMLDRDLLRAILTGHGIGSTKVKRAMPELVEACQQAYLDAPPVDLQRKVCPGVRNLLRRLTREDAVLGLVTGNLSAIAWKKLECAGLREHFTFGAFSEMGGTRALLARRAIQQARRNRWIHRDSRISLIGDHPNDVLAAKANGIQAIATATGPATFEELAATGPDILVSDLSQLSVNQLL